MRGIQAGMFYWHDLGDVVVEVLRADVDNNGGVQGLTRYPDGSFEYGIYLPKYLQPVTAEQMAAIGRDIDGNLLPPTPKVGEWWVLRNHFALIRGVDVHRGYATVHYVEAHYEQWHQFCAFARKATPEEAAAAQALYDLTRKAWAQEVEE